MFHTERVVHCTVHQDCFVLCYRERLLSLSVQDTIVKTMFEQVQGRAATDYSRHKGAMQAGPLFFSH